MKKDKKINLEKETTLTNQSTFSEEIMNILTEKDTPMRTKKSRISELLISELLSQWYFIRSNTNMYYFYNTNTTLYDIWRSEFEYLIHQLSNINPTDTIYSFLIKELEFHTKKHGKLVEIKEFSYYEKKSNTLYVFNNGNKIIKITESSISEINNWSDWIIFLKKEHHEEWNYKNTRSKKDYIWELIESINFNENILNKKEYIRVLNIYVNSLFFPDLLSNRPILVFVGEKWSGKSYVFEILSKIFYGDNTSLWTFQSKEDDIKTNLINEYFCVFDNVDGKVEDWKIDLLCSVATGTSIKARKLYKNNEIIITKVNCFIGITTRNPYFKRDDLCDRMIIVNLDRRSGWFESSNLSKEKFLKNRDTIMSYLCKKLQKTLKEIQPFKNYKSILRISDFSNFAINSYKSEEKELEAIFAKLVTAQQELTNSTDSLVILLEYLIEESKTSLWHGFKEWEFYTASELHKIFAQYAEYNKTHIFYGFKSVKSLSKSLMINQVSYKNINNITIETRKKWGNLMTYSFRKWVTTEEVQEVFK